MKVFIISVLLLTILISGCRNSNSGENNIKPGSICLIHDGYNTYGVVKVLTIDDDKVQLKIYTNRYHNPPDTIDINTLNTGSATENNLGIMQRKNFDMWKPVELNFEKVTKEDFIP